jgi:hypothetical protein
MYMLPAMLSFQEMMTMPNKFRNILSIRDERMGGQWGPLPLLEIFASLTKLEVILHKADLGYSVTIRQSLYLTSI